MPTYNYKCPDCGHTTDRKASIGERNMQRCMETVGVDTVCYGRLQRQPAAPAIQFKGSGFYATDYKGKP
jgi:putative FmdB family regulatory protein